MFTVILEGSASNGNLDPKPEKITKAMAHVLFNHYYIGYYFMELYGNPCTPAQLIGRKAPPLPLPRNTVKYRHSAIWSFAVKQRGKKDEGPILKGGVRKAVGGVRNYQIA